MANGRIFWSEASSGVRGRLFWSAVEAEPPATLSGRIFWSEAGPDAPPSVLTLYADAGAYVMTWAGSQGVIALEAEVGAYSAAGQAASFNVVGPYVLQADAGAYVMTGLDATLTGPAPVDSTAAAIWAYILPNGLTAGQVFCDLHKIHGLTPGIPLAVTSATRTAGDISQSISDSAGVVTVTRN